MQRCKHALTEVRLHPATSDVVKLHGHFCMCYLPTRSKQFKSIEDIHAYERLTGAACGGVHAYLAHAHVQS